MALVPLIAQADDCCCIVQGMDVPVVFQEMTNRVFQCVGETYCSRVMEGELFTPESPYAPQWEELRVQW